MSNGFFLFLALLLIIGAISWHRSGKKLANGYSADGLSRQDKMSIKICINASLEVIGYAVNPDASTPSEAISNGTKAIDSNGMCFANVLNALSSGMIANYSDQNKRGTDVAKALLLEVNATIADQFHINSSELWDLRGKILAKGKGPLEFLAQKAYQETFKLPAQARDSSSLREILLSAAAQQA